MYSKLVAPVPCPNQGASQKESRVYDTIFNGKKKIYYYIYITAAASIICINAALTLNTILLLILTTVK